MQIIAVVMMALYVLPLLTSHVLGAGNFWGFVFFLAIFEYARHFHQVNRFLLLKHRAFGLVLLALSIALLVLIISAIAHINGVDTTTQRHGTMVVLGCKVGSTMADERIEAAVSYLKEHPDTYVIVTGGYGDDEEMSEAEYMRQKMVYAGVDSAHIIMERESKSTYENLRNAMYLINEKNLSEHIIIVSNEFHLYRAGLIASRLHLSHDYLAAKTAWWLYPTFFTREIMAVIKAWIF